MKVRVQQPTLVEIQKTFAGRTAISFKIKNGIGIFRLIINPVAYEKNAIR
jgi:hypothetical protein